MANPSMYGVYGGGVGSGISSSLYSSRPGSGVTDPYAISSDPSRYYLNSSSDTNNNAAAHRGGGGYQTSSDAWRYAASAGVNTDHFIGVGGYPFGTSTTSRGAGASATAAASPWSTTTSGGGIEDPSVLASLKRQHQTEQAFYHQSFLGNHSSIGQSEALFSTNTLAKRPRLESAAHLPVYPQRPGEKDCAHYMLTRTCKFGESCKFDHPIWVPEGGIPDWKEVPLLPSCEALPERPGELDCPYFLKTQKCKFGFRCKFNHPKDKVDSSNAVDIVDVSVLPERPSEPLCAFYAKTGKCKFGATCKFHHPKDIQTAQNVQENGISVQTEYVFKNVGTVTGDAQLVKPFIPVTQASLHNSKGLPVRPGEVNCPFYLKTGSCKYGGTCRYNHPDRLAINPPVATGLSNAVISSPATNLNFGIINHAASILPAIDPRLAQTTLGVSTAIYPQRPGQIECDFYMKTGECKFGENCKYHHPIDRSAPTPSMAKQAIQQSVKLTLAGLPRREGTIICPFYMKTGTCKYGVTCRFDHPPPGEAIAMATVQGTAISVGGEEGDKGAETTEEPQL